MKKLYPVLMILAMCLISAAVAQEKEAMKLPAKENFKLVLLTGQSNMAGRGKVEAQDKVIHPRVLMLNREGQWVPAVDPVHYDKKEAGVGLGRTFGILLAESDPNITVGLIPAACGGSGISSWEPGKYWEQTKSHPYDDTLTRARRAMQDGTLTAILWHQGEADCGKSADVYAEKLEALITRMRTDLDAPKVPFIIGQLPQFKEKPWNKGRITVDKAQRAAGAKEFCGFVLSDGLTPNADLVHLDATSQREFGKRYFAAYETVVKNAAQTPATK